jgi:transcriptional regulator of heat shock response
MNPRTQNILEAAVREFIKIGEPISSGWLFDHYNFGIKPAMIRFELNYLTNRGFLEQPYRSAGRIPTNRGYEFFAEHILEKEREDILLDKHLNELFKEMEWADFLSRLSGRLKLLGVAAEPTEGRVYKDGLENLIDNLEWDSRAEIKSVIHDFEEIDSRVGEAAAEEIFEDKDFIKVFIGRKSPVTKSQSLSVMAGDYEIAGENIILLAIGPKRMDYEGTARVFKGLKKAENRK